MREAQVSYREKRTRLTISVSEGLLKAIDNYIATIAKRVSRSDLIGAAVTVYLQHRRQETVDEAFRAMVIDRAYRTEAEGIAAEFETGESGRGGCGTRRGF